MSNDRSTPTLRLISYVSTAIGWTLLVFSILFGQPQDKFLYSFFLIAHILLLTMGAMSLISVRIFEKLDTKLFNAYHKQRKDVFVSFKRKIIHVILFLVALSAISNISFIYLKFPNSMITSFILILILFIFLDKLIIQKL